MEVRIVFFVCVDSRNEQTEHKEEKKERKKEGGSRFFVVDVDAVVFLID